MAVQTRIQFVGNGTVTLTYQYPGLTVFLMIFDELPAYAYGMAKQFLDLVAGIVDQRGVLAAVAHGVVNDRVDEIEKIRIEELTLIIRNDGQPVDQVEHAPERVTT